MNKHELIAALARQEDISGVEAKKTVELFFDAMVEELCRGGRVELRGLWVIKVREYKSYTGRNPRSGVSLTVKPKKLPVFKSGMDLKKKVDR